MQTPRIRVHRLFAACVESKKTNRNLLRGPALARSINKVDWRRIFSEHPKIERELLWIVWKESNVFKLFSDFYYNF
jgi:hypothetical protein